MEKTKKLDGKAGVDEVVASISVPTVVVRHSVSVEDLGWGCMPNQFIDDLEVAIVTKGWVYQLQDFMNRTEFNAINCIDSVELRWGNV